jgi:alpha-mannosidase
MPQEHVLPALVWGSQVMQRIGRQVRRAEHKLLETERLTTMHYILTGQRPDQPALDEAWRTLMLAQHHDSWIVPYNRLNKQGTWADNIVLWTDNTCRLASQALVTDQSQNGGGRTTYYNTTGKTRKAVVTGVQTGGSEIDFQVELPPFGWVVVDADQIKQSKAEKHIKLAKGEVLMENGQYRLVFDLKRGGVLTSLYDKQQRREVVDKTNGFGFGELRGYFERDGRFRSSTETSVKAKILKDNAFVQSLSIEGEIAGVPFTQTYTLKKDEPQIDVELVIDWKRNVHIGNHQQRPKGDRIVPFYNTKYALSVFFPAALKEPKLWKDAPYDVCESHLDSTFFDRWTDIRHNIILSWVDVADSQSGLALLSDHTTSYSFAHDYPLALTVQYSGGGLWGRDHRITGKTQLHYALVPHQGHWDDAGITDISEMWNRPVIQAAGSRGENRSLLSLDGTGYQLSSMTVDADGSVLMRLYNADGNERPHDIRVDIPIVSVAEVDLQGNEVARPAYDNHRFTVQMPRFGIRTYRLSIR